MRRNSDRLLELARSEGVLRSRDAVSRGIPRITLTRLVREGRLERVGRGLYVIPGSDVSEHHSLVEACKRVPQGIVCLLSALRYHGLTAQDPSEVWMAISVKARKPRVDRMSLRIVRFGGEALVRGVEMYQVEGTLVRMTSPHRTVIDCFRYRNKIGVDVAIEALRDLRRQGSVFIDELWSSARALRAGRVMAPYLEALW
jgi:predicted transcriptional regulator of viral defense system